MYINQNRELMHRYIEEVWNKGNLGFIDTNFSPDCIIHDGFTGQPSGREGVKWVVSVFRTVSPDLHITIEDIIAEADKVVMRWSASGTHHGEFMGVPPTGKKLTIEAIVINRINADKIVEHWAKRDDLGLMQQLGIVSLPNMDK
jgi:steroid delta-isomerase-like uncharacterized protein